MAEPRWIELQAWSYDEDDWHLEIRAADAGFWVAQEFYAAPEALVRFADALQGFPRHSQDECLLEVGDPGAAHWVRLRVFIHDSRGHAAITIEVANGNGSVYGRSARFTIRCDTASLNGLGFDLRRWIDAPGAVLHQVLHLS